MPIKLVHPCFIVYAARGLAKEAVSLCFTVVKDVSCMRRTYMHVKCSARKKVGS